MSGPIFNLIHMNFWIMLTGQLSLVFMLLIVTALAMFVGHAVKSWSPEKQNLWTTVLLIIGLVGVIIMTLISWVITKDMMYF